MSCDCQLIIKENDDDDDDWHEHVFLANVEHELTIISESHLTGKR